MDEARPARGVDPALNSDAREIDRKALPFQVAEGNGFEIGFGLRNAPRH
jgi:hypothetical protein